MYYSRNDQRVGYKLDDYKTNMLCQGAIVRKLKQTPAVIKKFILGAGYCCKKCLLQMVFNVSC